jgi:hypothetical protein
MTERASFYRKIAYLVAMVLIAFAMFSLSEPATATREGGQLAQLREQYGLGPMTSKRRRIGRTSPPRSSSSPDCSRTSSRFGNTRPGT